MKGLNWFGAEDPRRIPYGLWERSLPDLMAFMSENGFNALRLFISLQNLDENKKTPPHFDQEESPTLVGTDYYGMIGAIAEAAAEQGILVIIACHQIRNGYPDSWPGSWDGKSTSDATYPITKILSLWSKLTQHFSWRRRSRICRR